MLRVAIVGCGKIADQHADHLAALPNCELVGVCDREELMAVQLRERFGVRAHYIDLEHMLKDARPDVVHITTPPQTHHSIALQCLQAGCHVYVEKPFTVNHRDAEELIAFADGRRLKVTVGQYAQCSHVARRMRALIQSGYLGGPPIHIESYYCYDLGDPAYAKALLGDPHHWVRGLPGGLLQNTISHGIGKIAEFLGSDRPTVITTGFTSQALRSVGEHRIIDELRTIIHDGSMTAYFTFSSQMRPTLHHLRVFGPKNAICIDENQQTLIKLRGARYKSYLEKFIPPYSIAKQYMGNLAHNTKLFLRNDFQEGHGMRELISAFHASILSGGPAPISSREILLTSRIMDEIFSQLSSGQSSSSEVPLLQPVVQSCEPAGFEVENKEA
ncbi:MAG: Gfo/Idh/MocA family oxidoreductase [Bryobacteraceae bacterium]|nr:Gfo/Idh/MocA family oxidoreductase [Bryobacteraceae bacterium]